MTNHKYLLILTIFLTSITIISSPILRVNANTELSLQHGLDNREAEDYQLGSALGSSAAQNEDDEAYSDALERAQTIERSMHYSYDKLYEVLRGNS